MWARIARFEGDPADVDARVARLRSMLESDGVPPELADAKILLLVDRASGGALGVTLFESEEAMRRGDKVMMPGKVSQALAPQSSSTRCHSIRSGDAVTC